MWGLIQPKELSNSAVLVELSGTYCFIRVGAVEVEDDYYCRLKMKPEVDCGAFKPASAPRAYTLDVVVHKGHADGADAAAKAGNYGML